MSTPDTITREEHELAEAEAERRGLIATPKTALFTARPIVFDIAKDDIATLARDYGTLTVRDENDKEGFAVVHDARMDTRSLRTGVEKARKEMKADYLKAGKIIDSAARELTDLLLPIEDHLLKQESIVTDAVERRKKEAEEKKAALIRTRLAALRACEYPGSITYREEETGGTTEEFEALLSIARGEKEEYVTSMEILKAEQARIAAEQKIEADRLAAERAEIEKIRAEQAAAQAKIDAENKRLLDEMQAKLDAAAAKEQAERDAAERAERLAREEFESQKRALAERERQDKLKPDYHKIMEYASALDGMAALIPELSEDVGAKVSEHQIRAVVTDCANTVREIGEELVRSQGA